MDECKPLAFGPHSPEVATAVRMLDATLGKAMHIDPMKPMLKAPGTERLKLKCDILV